MTGAVSRRFLVVVNRSAGGGRGAARAIAIASLLRHADAEVELAYSEDAAHGRQLAVEGALAERVVLACGGDGTIGGLAHEVGRIGGVLGLVPAGRGNDLARHLGLPTDDETLAQLLIHGGTRPLDLVDANGASVTGSVYAGIDARANEIANRSTWVPARFAYRYGALRAFLGWRPLNYRLEIDGDVREVVAHTVVVANSDSYGGGLRIAPTARSDDGLLDVVVIGAIARRRFVRVLNELPEGRHLRRAEVSVIRAQRVVIASDQAGPYAYGDGDPIGPLPVTIELRPAAVRVIAGGSVRRPNGAANPF